MVSFWHDHWLNVLAFPNLYKHTKKRKITVNEGLTNSKWISLIKHNLDTNVLSEFINLWHRTQVVLLSENGLLMGSTVLNLLICVRSGEGLSSLSRSSLTRQIKIPPKVQFFAWLAVQGKCLTADNLAKRGWPHNPLCPLCRLGWSLPLTCSHLALLLPNSNFKSC